MEIISTHVSSDFDAFAAMVAAKKLYPEAQIVLSTSLNQNVREFMVLHEEELPDFKEHNEIDIGKVKRLIMVDTKIASRLGPLSPLAYSKGVEIIVIDHHQKSDSDVSSSKEYYLDVGATTTIIMEQIIKRNISITPFEATLFALGIYEDTGSFTYPNTSYKDLETAAFLFRNKANLYILSRFLNLSLNEEQHKLFEELILNSSRKKINGRNILFSFAHSDRYIEGLSVLTRKLAQVEDARVVFCWAKMKEKTYIVGRSDEKDLDVSRILETVGGGGHPQAASSVTREFSFEEIRGRITDSLRKNIKRPLQAKDIMTFPVRLASEDETIISISRILNTYGHSGVPILDKDGKLTGVITRKDIDKAIKHGLSHAPVKGFKSGEVITAGPNATLEDIQQLMIGNSIGRVPIVSGKNILGIITRKDVLRYLTDSQRHGMPITKKKKHDIYLTEIKDKIGSLFPQNVQDIFSTISALSARLKIRAYLVGGIVRDILLNRTNLDIDIVVERQGIIFATELAKKLKASLYTHEKFKTSVIVLEDGSHIDIATARVEFYERPAALPSVEEGSIKQDLYRRDFTINSMAVSLDKKDFGKLIDFFGGRKDLAEKRIKVLHKLSIVEDPTRIFRAIRFEQRFGFKMDNQTEELVKSAIEMDVVSLLTGVRIRDELICIFEEQNVIGALKRLDSLGALKKIGIDIETDNRFYNWLKKILETCKELSGALAPSQIQKWHILFIILLSNKKDEDLRAWCEQMKVKKKDMNIIRRTIRSHDKVKEKLKEAKIKNSDLYYILKNSTHETQVILASYGGNIKRNVMRYLKELRDVKTFIDGTKIKEMGYQPSADFKKILDILLKKRLDGQISTYQEELREVKDFFLERPATSPGQE
jgi:tRNA nucleotidyltransferase (CCA-adding enzyme)